LSQNHGDAAAIMIGAGALGYSVFSRDGLYEAYDLGVAAAIVVVLIAYIWPSWRTFLQSLALAILLGGCSIPIVGYSVVLIFNPPAHGWNGTPGDNAVGAGSCIIFALLALILDRHQNKARKKPA
jgi:hypothetical protein